MKKKLEGKEIVEARVMTDKEMKEEGFHNVGRGYNPCVLVLDDGTKVFPSKDTEGNGPGCLFGTMPDGQQVRFI